MKKHQPQSNRVLLYGKHPVLSAIAHKRRKFYQLLITKNNEAEFKKFLAEKNIKFDNNLIKLVDNNYLNNLLPDATHQGFALDASLIENIPEENFFDKIKKFDKENLPTILILDELTDPHNIGAIIRSAVAFGVKNIVITERNFSSAGAIIAKSSSGMVELVDLILAHNLNNFLGNLKKIGYWSVGLDGEAKTTIDKAKDYKPLALVLGSEGTGIRRLVKSNCDLLVKIAMNNEVESLNVSNAAAIALYECTKL